MATQVNLHSSLQCASSSLPFVALSTLYFLWSNCFDLMSVVKMIMIRSWYVNIRAYVFVDNSNNEQATTP